MRSSECDVDIADVDLAAVVQVYNDLASSLRTFLYNYPAPQDVVLTPIHETGYEPHSPTLIEGGYPESCKWTSENPLSRHLGG